MRTIVTVCQGLALAGCAASDGIHQTYLSGVETGARNPTITVLKKLADALGVRPAALLE